MRLVDYIFLANKNLSRRKKTVIINTILISISTIIFILGLSFTKCFMSVVNKAILNNPSYRTIVVMGIKENDKDNIIEKIKEDKNIAMVVNEKEYNTYATLKNIDTVTINKGIDLNGASESVSPQVISGRNIKNSDENVCIIPKKVNFYSRGDVLDKDEYIDGEKLIGKKITIEYSSRDDIKEEINKTFSKELEIIGVYDGDEYVVDGNEFYVPFTVVSKIRNDIEENWIKEPNTVYSGGNNIYAIVNNSLNTEKSFEKIQALGYRAIIRSTTNTLIVVVINTIVGIVVVVFLLIVLINITSSTIRSIDERKYEIGMLKAIGYKNKNIRKLLLVENLIIGVRAYLIGLIVSIIGMKIMQINIFEKNYDFYPFNIRVDVIICLVASIITVVVPTLATLFSSKKLYSKTAISLSKER